jgi:outer membrane protein assembly factor BamB
MRYGEKNLAKLPGGGGSSPVVAGGLVFLSYFVPSGDVVDEAYLDREREFGRETTPDHWRIGADDVLHAIDAATGQTAWRRVFAGQGINWHDAKAGPCNVTPCVDGGRLFAVGTTGRLYCVDARTGAEIWQADLGRRHRQIEEIKAECLRKRSFGGHSTFNRDFGGAPVVLDGVLVLPDFDGNPCGLLGLDAASGAVRWRIPKATAQDAIPARWIHGGRAHAVTATPGGKVFCTEAKSGRVLWTLPVSGHNPRSVMVHEDWLLLNVGPVPDSAFGLKMPPLSASRLAAFRLAPDGPARAWELPAEYGSPRHNPVVVHDGRVWARLPKQTACIELVTGRILAEVPAAGDGIGFFARAGDRLLLDRDGAHNATELHLYDAADPARLVPLGAPWKPPHPHTTSYWVAMVHPVVGGRIYIRGADALYCYDLTAPPGE